MTIQEAIKSGKPFKRKSYKTWLITYTPILGDDLEFYTEDKKTDVIIFPVAILADDWEVKND